MSHTKTPLARASLLVLLLIAVLTAPSHAYVDLAPTLARVISDAQQIGLVEIVEFDRANHALVLKPVRTLKGEPLPDSIRHDVAAANGGVVPRPIMQWASPGAGRAV